MRALIVSAAAALAVLAVPAIASANQNTVDATCAGLTFDMARGEAGTLVSVSLDGTVVRSSTIANQNDALSFTIPSPDQTRPHSWVVVIDSVWNTDQRVVRTVEPCVTPTTPPTTTVAPTTVPAVTPQVPTGSTGVTSTPPATVITTPRPSATTSTVPAATTSTSVPSLPATGADPMTLSTLAAAAVALGCVASLIVTTRRKGQRS